MLHMYLAKDSTIKIGRREKQTTLFAYFISSALLHCTTSFLISSCKYRYSSYHVGIVLEKYS